MSVVGNIVYIVIIEQLGKQQVQKITALQKDHN